MSHFHQTVLNLQTQRDQHSENFIYFSFGFFSYSEFVFMSFDKNPTNLIAFVLFNRQVLGMVDQRLVEMKQINIIQNENTKP